MEMESERFLIGTAFGVIWCQRYILWGLADAMKEYAVEISVKFVIKAEDEKEAAVFAAAEVEECDGVESGTIIAIYAI